VKISDACTLAVVKRTKRQVNERAKLLKERAMRSVSYCVVGGILELIWDGGNWEVAIIT